MLKSRIAAQLYSVRDFLKTPEDIAKSLKKIKEIGYEAVQLSGLGPIETTELIKILDGEGLNCCATHESTKDITEEPQKVIDKLNALNCKYTAYPYPGGINLRNLDELNDLIKKLDASGEKLYNAGQTLCYHNHHVEFIRHGDKTVLEMIYEGTNKNHLQGEPDTYWVQFGGGDVVSWMEKLRGRLPLLHLKDFKLNDENQPTFCEVGAGNLEWNRILPEAELSGCHYYIVEQDICPVNPFISLKQSFDYLVSNFCK